VMSRGAFRLLFFFFFFFFFLGPVCISSGCTSAFEAYCALDCSWLRSCSCRKCELFHEPYSSNRDPQEPWARVTRYRDATSKWVSSRRSEVWIFQGTERAWCIEPVKISASVPSASKSSLDTS
jgi:hypothetical protein